MEQFQITLNKDFNQGANLFDQKVVIASKPKHVYDKWWHRIMYYITFKQRFVEGWEYEVELK
jgi:hypothetical protein